jgi:hypothetical protein
MPRTNLKRNRNTDDTPAQPKDKKLRDTAGYKDIIWQCSPLD